MADASKVIPFILKWEGGLSKDKADKASANPVPDGSGYHTNKGITWKTWSSMYGSGSNSIKDFYAMPQDKWLKIYVKYFWNNFRGNDIKSQRIADILANWTWGAGTYYPVVRLQKILKITPDGVVGNDTINAINNANETDLYNKLKASNIDYFNQLVKKPDYAVYKVGWFNRLNDFYNNYVGDAVNVVKKNYKPILVISALIGGAWIAKKYKLI